MNAPRPYDGPFDPPPSDYLIGAIGWRHETEFDPDRPGHWRPTGWMMVYPDHVLRVGLDGLAYRASLLWAP